MGDYATASEYYLRSSEQSYPPAQHQLALLYLDKKATASLPSGGATSSHASAKGLLLSAADQNYSPSHFILATRLHHDGFNYLEKAAALRDGPALDTLRRSRDGSLWTEGDCVEIKQPDFPFLVPLAVSLAADQSSSGDEERKGNRSPGYAPLALCDVEAHLGKSFRDLFPTRHRTGDEGKGRALYLFPSLGCVFNSLLWIIHFADLPATLLCVLYLSYLHYSRHLASHASLISHVASTQPLLCGQPLDDDIKNLVVCGLSLLLWDLCRLCCDNGAKLCRSSLGPFLCLPWAHCYFARSFPRHS
jgi:hypothetical protein